MQLIENGERLPEWELHQWRPFGGMTHYRNTTAPKKYILDGLCSHTLQDLSQQLIAQTGTPSCLVYLLVTYAHIPTIDL